MKKASTILIIIGIIGFISCLFSGDFSSAFIGGGLIILIGVLLRLKSKNKASESHPEPEPETDVHIFSPKEEYFVVGAFKFQDELDGFMIVENEDYSLSKKEMIEQGLEDVRIYEYERQYYKAKLIPEPENEFDKNAIAVYIENTKIGYVKRDDQNALSGLSEINCEIFGGKYKIVEDESLHKSSSEYGVVMYK